MFDITVMENFVVDVCSILKKIGLCLLPLFVSYFLPKILKWSLLVTVELNRNSAGAHILAIGLGNSQPESSQ
jgi:hypothetical protein